jgi:peptide/nickel transport system permease protein
MFTYIVRRVLIALPVLIGITIITYTAYSLAPGNPIDAMIDPKVAISPEALLARKRALGLDQPIPVRYLIWLREAVQGNLGYSYRTNTPVFNRIAERLPATLQLTVTAFAIAIGLGVPLGVLSAVRQYSRLDVSLTFLALSGISVPTFFVGLVAIWLFSLKLRLFPSFGMVDPDSSNQLLSRLQHLVLPACVLGFEGVAGFLRYTRSSMLDVLQQDYMRTARAKGLVRWRAVLKHGVRNALLSVITLIGLRLPSLIGGAFIIESIFAWPGMGQMAIASVVQRDYPVLMGLTLASSTLILLSSLVTDVVYVLVDPRIKL